MIPPHVYKEAEDAMPTAFMPGVQSQSLCDALRWITAVGRITYISNVKVLMALQGYLPTVTAEISHEKNRQQVEHVPIALPRSPGLVAHLLL